jgi:hypothetical protein
MGDGINTGVGTVSGTSKTTLASRFSPPEKPGWLGTIVMAFFLLWFTLGLILQVSIFAGIIPLAILGHLVLKNAKKSNKYKKEYPKWLELYNKGFFCHRCGNTYIPFPAGAQTKATPAPAPALPQQSDPTIGGGTREQWARAAHEDVETIRNIINALSTATDPQTRQRYEFHLASKQYFYKQATDYVKLLDDFMAGRIKTLPDKREEPVIEGRTQGDWIFEAQKHFENINDLKKKISEEADHGKRKQYDEWLQGAQEIFEICWGKIKQFPAAS